MFGNKAGQLKRKRWTGALRDNAKTRLMGNANSRVIEGIAKTPLRRNFMIDYAPALEG